MIKFVFFDAGETLLRAEPSFPELAAIVLQRRGHDVSASDVIEAGRELGSHFRSAADTNWVFSASADESRAFWTAFYTDMMGRLDIDDPQAPDELFTTFSDPANYGLFPDVVAVLNELKEAGYRLGVISNFEGWLDGLLKQLNIRDHFDVVAISGPLNVEKPNPKIFEWAIDQAEVEPGECAHVGDQPYFDAEASQACGMRGVLLDRYDRWEDSPEYPRISGLAELPEVISGLSVNPR